MEEIVQICSEFLKQKSFRNFSKFSEDPWKRSSRANNSTYQEAAASSDRTQRLGLTTGYGGAGSTGVYGTGYGTGLSPYQPVKLDLGGVVLGALIGVGALLVLPKVFHAFSGGYGGNYRSILLYFKILHFLLKSNSYE